MTVYIVMRYLGEDGDAVDSVYATRQKAQEFIDSKPLHNTQGEYRDAYEIQEWDVNS